MERSQSLVGACALLLGVIPGTVFAQAQNFTAARAEVDFSRHLRAGDGFGVNYVEVAQAIDYSRDPQEYGGSAC